MSSRAETARKEEEGSFEQGTSEGWLHTRLPAETAFLGPPIGLTERPEHPKLFFCKPPQLTARQAHHLLERLLSVND